MDLEDNEKDDEVSIDFLKWNIFKRKKSWKKAKEKMISKEGSFC